MPRRTIPVTGVDGNHGAIEAPRLAPTERLGEKMPPGMPLNPETAVAKNLAIV